MENLSSMSNTAILNTLFFIAGCEAGHVLIVDEANRVKLIHNFHNSEDADEEAERLCDQDEYVDYEAMIYARKNPIPTRESKALEQHGMSLYWP